MSISVKAHFPGWLRRTVKPLPAKDSKNLMKQAGNIAVGIIQKRTQSGMDNKNKRMAEYSPGYKAYKKKRGRSGKVDLTFKGTMLNNMKVKSSTKDKVIIGFTGEQAAKALKHQTGKGVKKRPFFGLSKEDRKEFWPQVKDLALEIIHENTDRS